MQQQLTQWEDVKWEQKQLTEKQLRSDNKLANGWMMVQYAIRSDSIRLTKQQQKQIKIQLTGGGKTKSNFRLFEFSYEMVAIVDRLEFY